MGLFEVCSRGTYRPFRRAVGAFIKQKYGEKRVAFDPSNPDANGAALAGGYTIIPSRGLSSGQRQNAYEHGFLHTASEEFPTAGKGAYGKDGEPVPVIEEDKWSDAMRNIVRYTEWVGKELLGKPIFVRIVLCKHFEGKAWGACYGYQNFDYNLWTLGKKWFDQGITEDVDKLIIHELAHDLASNHVLDDYHEACCLMGAKLKRLALDDPDKFDEFD
jgi:hypothetical protein